DLAYSYKPGSRWVDSHWMKLNGKRDNFTREDFYTFEKLSPLFSKRKIDRIIDEIKEHVSKWHSLAVENSVPKSLVRLIETNLRLRL
ncbi:MAG: type II toxin-antitoxin system HipA family toxin, partial [Desulfobacterales bacterium]|nr:type II toxin-antitoxin system HipA family toxin [Desulfobacterales bacterium]